MSARLPRKLTVLLLSAGLVLLAVSVYLEITELDLLQRHPILVNLLSGAVGFCFGVVALSAAEFVPPLIDGTVEAVVAAARSWIDEVEASSYHAAHERSAVSVRRALPLGRWDRVQSLSSGRWYTSCPST